MEFEMPVRKGQIKDTAELHYGVCIIQCFWSFTHTKSQDVFSCISSFINFDHYFKICFFESHQLYGAAIGNLWTAPLSALPEGTFMVVGNIICPLVFCYFKLLNPTTSHLLTGSSNLLHSNVQCAHIQYTPTDKSTFEIIPLD